jgi:hypothetical protein
VIPSGYVLAIKKGRAARSALIASTMHRSSRQASRGGLTGALACAVATCELSCTVAFVAFRLGHRFRDAPWQRIVLRGLVPVTVGIVIPSGYVEA